MTVTLVLDSNLRVSLLRLLTHARSMADGARVDAVLGPEPWGNLKHFQQYVFVPLAGDDEAAPPGSYLSESTFSLKLSRDDATELRGVLLALSESMAGGVPWIELSENEKRIVTAVLDEMSH